MKTVNFINGNTLLQILALASLLLVVVFAARADDKDIVINEIMYHPPNDLEHLQYVELFNRGNAEVDISNWSFSKGIKYTFPSGARMAPGDYVVVCRDVDAFVKAYRWEIAAYGNFKGRLSHRGETLQLSDSQKRVIDAVKYADRAPWPVGADGYSSSLERISPFVESQRADKGVSFPSHNPTLKYGASFSDGNNWAASKLPAKRTPKGTPGRQNDNYSANLPPTIKDVHFSPLRFRRNSALVTETKECPSPEQAVTVRANVSDSDGLAAVTLLYRVAKPGSETTETQVPMKHISGETYEAVIPGQPDKHLVRFRIKAVDSNHTVRIQPSENEPRWTYSYYVYADFVLSDGIYPLKTEKTQRGNIPFGFIVHVDEAEYHAVMRERNRELEEMIRRTMNLETPCYHLMVSIDLEAERLEKVKNIYCEASEKREKFILEATLTGMRGIATSSRKFNQELSDKIHQALTEKQYVLFKEKRTGQNTQQPRREDFFGGEDDNEEERRRQQVERMFRRGMNLEDSWFFLTVSLDLNSETLTRVRDVYQEAFENRQKLIQETMSFASEREQMRDMFMKIRDADRDFSGTLRDVLTDEQITKFDEWRMQQNPWMRRGRGGPGRTSGAPASLTRGNSAFIYVPADGKEVLVFDHVRIAQRKGGFKVRFHKDQTLRDITTINVIFEYIPRFVLSEPLAYELYRMAGVPAELTEHIRLWINDRLYGYHLSIEQPNRAFLRRNKRDDTGSLYKLLWYEEGIVRKHEKKTNLLTGHGDIINLINGLNETSGEEQWEYIKKHFNVEEFVNYFAVNMCLSNWDGFFNNYFTYHDINGTGKWEIYPWDEDKTWGFYDGISLPYAFYDMPLTFGMTGDQAPGRREGSRRGGRRGGPDMWGGAGAPSWWRPAGYFSGQMLANPYFRKQFLARLKEICLTIFTEEKFFPIIDAMEKRLEPEVRIRAEALNQNPSPALRTFHADMQSFRTQVTNRRKFILSQLKMQ